jgi:hypothetical protein
MEGDVYGFGVEDVEITEVAEKAEITEVAEKAEITEVAEMAKMFRMIIRMTARHVIRLLAEKAEVSEMAKAFSKTTRHVM